MPIILTSGFSIFSYNLMDSTLIYIIIINNYLGRYILLY